MIRLVGPGGAGKTTIGFALAHRLGIPFIDLDKQFTRCAGDISAYLENYGYRDYAHRNTQVYLDILAACGHDTVLALSSGFMTYPGDTHPAYRNVYEQIVASPSAVALLPSFDRETCVAETVRRQLQRSFRRSADREEQVIRARFSVYASLPMKKFETAKPLATVIEDLVAHLLPNTRFTGAPGMMVKLPRSCSI